MSECLIVLDAGTGSGRAVVFDSDGRQLGVGQEEWTHLSEPDAPGSMSFDCDQVLQLVAVDGEEGPGYLLRGKGNFPSNPVLEKICPL